MYIILQLSFLARGRCKRGLGAKQTQQEYNVGNVDAAGDLEDINTGSCFYDVCVECNVGGIDKLPFV